MEEAILKKKNQMLHDKMSKTFLQKQIHRDRKYISVVAWHSVDLCLEQSYYEQMENGPLEITSVCAHRPKLGFGFLEAGVTGICAPKYARIQRLVLQWTVNFLKQ